MTRILTIISILSISFCNAQTFSRIYDFQNRNGFNQAINIEPTDYGYLIFQKGVAEDWETQGGIGVLGIDEEGNIVFDKEFGNLGFVNDVGWANSGDITEQGTYIVSGIRLLNELGDVTFYEFDENGDSIQSYIYTSPFWDEANAVIQSDDGGYVIVGRTNDTNSGDFGGLLLKLNSEAEFEWLQYYEDSGNDINGISVINSHEGGYILGGG